MNHVRCPACQSEKIIPRREITDQTNSQSQMTFLLHPDALVFKQRYRTPIYVNVCGECGHCSLFIENPTEAWDAYIKTQKPA